MRRLRPHRGPASWGSSAPPSNNNREDLPRPLSQGPGCSDRPSQPIHPLTKPTTESDGAKELAAHFNGSNNRADGLTRQRAPLTIGSPVHLPKSIFDPPRAT